MTGAARIGLAAALALDGVASAAGQGTPTRLVTDLAERLSPAEVDGLAHQVSAHNRERGVELALLVGRPRPPSRPARHGTCTGLHWKRPPEPTCP